MANAIKNFHFDFLHPSLKQNHRINIMIIFWNLLDTDSKRTIEERNHVSQHFNRTMGQSMMGETRREKILVDDVKKPQNLHVTIFFFHKWFGSFFTKGWKLRLGLLFFFFFLGSFRS